jgi:hypothetical protein
MSDSTTAPNPNANARSAETPKPAPPGIDPRGPRFGAAVTAALLAITLLLGTGPAATALLTVRGSKLLDPYLASPLPSYQRPPTAPTL